MIPYQKNEELLKPKCYNKGKKEISKCIDKVMIHYNTEMPVSHYNTLLSKLTADERL